MADAYLADLPDDTAQRLRDLRPDPMAFTSGYKEVNLHGDPVPGNMVASPRGLILIDWQCPAIGDPASDLAIFLSPAMQTLYRSAPLTPCDAKRFLTAYGDEATVFRYLHRAPLYHYRIAAHCLWRAHLGHEGYGSAAAAEFAYLERINEPAPV